jgi:arginine decarboxylase-like protein
MIRQSEAKQEKPLLPCFRALLKKNIEKNNRNFYDADKRLNLKT